MKTVYEVVFEVVYEVVSVLRSMSRTLMSRTLMSRTLMSLCGLLSLSTAYGQGYEWEWSPRAPLSMPTRYVGVEVAGQYALHTGSLEYFEELIPCCDFTSGTGVPLRLTIIAEQWVKPSLSVQAGIGVMFQGSSFTAPGDTLPRADQPPIVTEYAMETSITSLTLQGGVRQRLFDTFLSIGLDLRGLITVGSSQSLEDRVVSPDDYMFTTNPPSRVRDLSGAQVISDVTVFVFEPSVVLQYDIALARGSVLSPSVNVSMPFGSLSTSQSWSYVAVGIGMRLSRGF